MAVPDWSCKVGGERGRIARVCTGLSKFSAFREICYEKPSEEASLETRILGSWAKILTTTTSGDALGH